MPKFTITTHNSKDSNSAKDWFDFPDTKAATDDAQVALGEMVREKLPNGKHADFGVQVENEAGKQVYRAALNFNSISEAEIEREDADAEAAAHQVARHLAGRSSLRKSKF